MKRSILLHAATALLLLGTATGCQQEIVEDNAPSQGAMREIIIQASMGEPGVNTRASMTPSGDDFMNTTWVSQWQSHDQLGAWSTGVSQLSDFNINAGYDNETKSASFTGQIPQDATQVRFIYPYDAAATITSNTYTVDISTQVCDGGAVFHHYAKNKPMVSELMDVSDGNIADVTLHNLCAGMEYRIKLDPAITQTDVRLLRVELTGANIKSTATLALTDGELTYSDAANQTIAMNIENSPQLDDYKGEKYFSVVGSVFPFEMDVDDEITLTAYTNYGLYTRTFKATETMNFGLGKHHYLSVTINAFTVSNTWLGKGTAADPYLIRNHTDMKYIANCVKYGSNDDQGGYIEFTSEGVHFKLMNDIDLECNEQEQWLPIGVCEIGLSIPFAGTFDGNGKRVTGLYINTNSQWDNMALFGNIEGATIKNLIVEGNVTGGGNNAGIVANALNSTIINCCNAVVVTGGVYASGGIAGIISNTSIMNCYNTAAINASRTANYFGSIAGYADNQSKLKNCYTLKDCAETGYFVDGQIINEGVQIEQCYDEASTDISLTTLNTNAASIPGACAWMEGADGYPTFAFEELPVASGEITDNWIDFVAPNFGGGQGTQKNPYIISTPQELAKLAADVNGDNTYSGKYFALACDIDLSGKQWTAIGVYKNMYGVVIEKPFDGTFDGNNKKITGLYINNSNTRTDVQGLFGYLGNSGTVQNLRMSGSITVQAHNVGGVIAYNTGIVKGCSFSGTVSATVWDTAGGNSSCTVGGIVGCSKGTIISCHNTGMVTATSQSTSASPYIGGVVGNTYTSITSCYNIGTVSVMGDSNSYVGGIAGVVEIISSCYNNGAVSTSGGYTGGIAGSSISITSCYNTGAVTGENSNIGGIAGNTYSRVEYSYCLNATDGGTDTTIGSGNATLNNVAALSKAEMTNGTMYSNLILGDSNYWKNRTGDYPWLGF